MSAPESYRRHRFPLEVVEQYIWLYFRFALSYRNIEELMAKYGVQLTYETIREWCQKFGPLYAAQLRKKRARVGSKWHLDEVFLKMNGFQHYRWRAVDQNGATIDILVQPKRDRLAALRFFRKASPGSSESAARHRHRQAAKLCCREADDLAGGRASAKPLSQQPGRERASTHPCARTADKTLSIC